MNNKVEKLDRIITRKKLCELIGISRTTEWRMAKKNLLPKRFVLNGKTLGYLESSYLEWLSKNNKSS